MTVELIQDMTVTLIALAAAAMLLRRVTGLVRRTGPNSGCSSCPSRQTACTVKEHVGRAAGSAPIASGQIVPVTEIRLRR